VEILRRPGLPEPEAYRAAVLRAEEALLREPPEVRPPSRSGEPGGLILLRPDLPTVLVPDLHARTDFLASVLALRPEGGQRVLDRLAEGSIQVVCVGDGFHAEGRAAARWQAALEEFRHGYRKHEAMDAEMRESLGLMEMVMELKTSLPRCFHFLKGNHENIANEQGDGNYPFLKFANEGLMVLVYMRAFFGDDVLEAHARFEKRLPLLAVGRNFLVSHAEPAGFFSREEVLEYRELPEVIYGLTWTDNGDAEENSVGEMLAGYLGATQAEQAYYFGGHRPVRGRFAVRAEGRYVQIHNPESFVVAVLPAEGEIDPERDIGVIEQGELGAEEDGQETGEDDR
jgi:hypothetical protein